MKQILTLILFLVTTISLSQSPYIRQQSAGEIPNDLILSIQQKIENDKLEMLQGTSSISKVERKFLENTNRKIDELLQSGKILFGDEMTNYINKLAKLILEKNNKPELIKKLRFYTVKSSVVNAFATHQGMIFVNVGLLAQIENESQLAFVLAHEISHYIQEHVLESHLNTMEYVNNRRSSNKGYDDVILELSSYSKGQEFESDSIGYLMYTKAGYNPEDAAKAMNVLQYSHLPFDEIPIEKDFFNKDSYKLNLQKYFSDKTIVYKDISDRDDSRSSHPNIKSRKTKMYKLASYESKFKIKNEYLLGKEVFEKIQNIARLDNLKNNLTSRNYIKVVYEAYLLKRILPNEPYVDYCLAKGLYAVSKLKTYDNFSSVFSNENFEGEISKLYQLFSQQLTDYEINILALKHLLVLKNENFKKYEDDLINDLVNKIEFNCDKFKNSLTIQKDTTIKKIKTFKVLDSLELAQLTKIDRIIYTQKLKKHKEGDKVVEVNDKYYLNAFITEMNDQNFKSRFDIKKELKEERDSDEKIDVLNDSIDMDGYIIVEPILISTSERKGVKEKESETRSNNLQTLIADVSDKLEINYVVASREGNKNNLVSEYNGEAATKEWYYQYYTYEEYKILPLNTAQLYEFAEKHKTNYVYHTWIYTKNENPNIAIISYLIYTAPLYPVYPAIMYFCTTKKQHNYIYNKIINIHTNKYVLDTYDKTNKKLREFNIRSIIYNKLKQIK